MSRRGRPNIWLWRTRLAGNTVEPDKGLIEHHEKTAKDITMQKAAQDLVSVQFWCA